MITEHDNKVNILLYHQIGTTPVEETNLDCFCLANEFEKQMEYLFNSEIKVISLNTLMDYLIKGTSFEKDCVVLTFDDGCNKFIGITLPILNKFNFPATIFPVSGNLGSEAAWPKIKNPDLQILTKEELRFLHSKGIDIGGHSVNHKKLTQIAKDEALKEITNCKIQLESIIGSEITSFSFPHGEYNDKIVSLVKKVGFSSAVTCDSSKIQKNNSVYKLPRKYVTFFDDLESFKNLLNK